MNDRVTDMHDYPAAAVPGDEHAEQASATFRLLSDPTRVKILWSLLQGESSVGSLADAVGTSPTSVSQHLAKLRLAGIVTTRRQGTFIYYSATDQHVHRLLAEALSHAEHVSGTAQEAHPHTYRA